MRFRSACNGFLSNKIKQPKGSRRHSEKMRKLSVNFVRFLVKHIVKRFDSVHFFVHDYVSYKSPISDGAHYSPVSDYCQQI